MKVSDEQKKNLLALQPEDLTLTKFIEIFGDTTTTEKGIKKENKSKLNPTDTLTLYPTEYFVKEPTKTTVGRLLYNKYIVEACGLQDILGYVNTFLSDTNNGKMEAKLATALIEDKMTLDQFKMYIDRRDNLGMTINSIICTSFTKKSAFPIKSVQARKKELFKKYDKELNEGNIHISEQIEKELTTLAKKELKGDFGMDLFDSEARGNFASYKNMFLFKGATPNRQTGGYDILRTSYVEGIKKEDISSFGTAVVTGQYPKSIGTGDSGYKTKQLLASMQSEVLDKKGSDCGTQHTLDLKLTEGNYKRFLYRYIKENGGYTRLDTHNINKYLGKVVKLRSPMYCRGKSICNICAGDLNYILGNLNIGLGASKISGKLLKMGMKKFHSANLASKEVDIDDIMF